MLPHSLLQWQATCRTPQNCTSRLVAAAVTAVPMVPARREATADGWPRTQARRGSLLAAVAVIVVVASLLFGGAVVGRSGRIDTRRTRPHRIVVIVTVTTTTTDTFTAGRVVILVI